MLCDASGAGPPISAGEAHVGLVQIDGAPGRTRWFLLGLGLAERRLATAMPEELHEGVAWLLTEHGVYRMGARQISMDTVQHVLRYGRAVWTRGARVFAIGQKEVR